MRGEKFEDWCGITSNVIGILEGISRENEEESVITEIIPRQCPRAQWREFSDYAQHLPMPGYIRKHQNPGNKEKILKASKDFLFKYIQQMGSQHSITFLHNNNGK